MTKKNDKYALHAKRRLRVNGENFTVSPYARDNEVDLHISMGTRLNGHGCVASNLVFIENKQPRNNAGFEKVFLRKLITSVVTFLASIWI